MKVGTVVKPAVLFAAGSVASAASAAPVIEHVNYSATRPATAITLAGADEAQYLFSLDTREGFYGPKDGYYLTGVHGAQISATSLSTPGNALNAPTFTNEVKTGSPDGVSALVAGDTYYGLRFSANGVDYKGYAGVTSDGSTINRIGYTPSDVPEPATWALMIAGFGGVGMAMRRRRRQAPAAAVA